jgi:histidinol-phosphate phosphatase family protein
MEGPFVQLDAKFSPKDLLKSPIAFLDRDGVVNRGKAGYVNAPEEVVLLPGAAEAIARLRTAGYIICVVTNQSPISRGLWGPNQLESIHHALSEQLRLVNHGASIDAYITCPHRFEDGCSCRKPSPAMLYLGDRVLRENTLESYTFTPQNAGLQSYAVDWWGSKPTPRHALDAMVGDRRSDMGAGWGYGARLFRVHGSIGLEEVVDRVLNESDRGDSFQP